MSTPMFLMIVPIASAINPGQPRTIDNYNLPLEAGDEVKVRKTHPTIQADPESNVAEMTGQRGKVVGVQNLVTVEFEDGSVKMFDRDELSFWVNGVPSNEPAKEPWQG